MESDTVIIYLNTSIEEIKKKIEDVSVNGKVKHLAVLSGKNYFSIVQYEDETYDLWCDGCHLLRYASSQTVAEFIFAECRITGCFDNWRK